MQRLISSMQIAIDHYGLYFVVDVDENMKARLIHFSSKPYSAEPDKKYNKYYTLLELHCLGEDINDHHGSRHTYTSPAADLKYISHNITLCGKSKLLEIRLSDARLDVTLFYQFFESVPVVRCWNQIVNITDNPVVLDYITSFAYYGLTDEVNGTPFCNTFSK